MVIHLHLHFLAHCSSNLEVWIWYLSSTFRDGDVAWKIRQIGWWGTSAISLVPTSASTFVQVSYKL